MASSLHLIDADCNSWHFRGRRKRAKSEDSDPDYEGERSERSGGRPMRGRAAARRSTAASNPSTHAHQEHGYSPNYTQAQRQQQVSSST